MFVDLPLDHLRSYTPPRTENDDFDRFWSGNLADARDAAGPARFDPVPTELLHLDTFDVTFTGYAGQPVKAWLHLPRHQSGPLPAVVEYLGYGGGRGHHLEPTLWPGLGYAHLIMDSRGQASTWSSAETPDGLLAPQIGGVLTRGIASPRTHYYPRLFTDAVRAIDTLRAHPAVDADRILVRGASQGGGIAIAAAALTDGLAGAMIDVPFLSHFRRATQITDDYPYREISDYLQQHPAQTDAVFDTLSYVDAVNLAARATAPALFSVALMDTVCPPSTVFAAYNHWAGTDKTITVFEYNGHEGGGRHHTDSQVTFAAART